MEGGGSMQNRGRPHATWEMFRACSKLEPESHQLNAFWKIYTGAECALGRLCCSVKGWVAAGSQAIRRY